MHRAKTWRYGKPRHIGFWLTAIEGCEETTKQWRWWDGLQWSWAIDPRSTMGIVIENAGKYTLYGTSTFVYSNYWPKNARVPRIDPRTSNQ